MSVKTSEYAANLAVSSVRGRSPSVWFDCPWPGLLEQANEFVGGMYTYDDFDSGMLNVASNVGSFGRWAAYASTGGFVVDGAAEGGVITLGSDGDNEGVAFNGGINSYRLTTTSTLALNQQLWFEARVARSSVTATKGDFFVGLFNGFLNSSTGLPTTAIPITTTDNTLADVDLIGFHSKGNGPTEWNFVYKLTGQAVVYPTGLTTLMNSVLGAVMTAGQFVKLGFRFNPNAAPIIISSASTGQTAGQVFRPLIQVYVNGLPAAAFLTSVNVQGTAFPTAFMAPGFAVMNQTGSSPPTMSVDWIRAAQLANT